MQSTEAGPAFFRPTLAPLSRLARRPLRPPCTRRTTGPRRRRTPAAGGFAARPPRAAAAAALCRPPRKTPVAPGTRRLSGRSRGPTTAPAAPPASSTASIAGAGWGVPLRRRPTRPDGPTAPAPDTRPLMAAAAGPPAELPSNIVRSNSRPQGATRDIARYGEGREVAGTARSESIPGSSLGRDQEEDLPTRFVLLRAVRSHPICGDLMGFQGN